jgi:hypothetical protein
MTTGVSMTGVTLTGTMTDSATGVETTDAATVGTVRGSSTTAFECLAARATGDFSEVFVLPFLVEGTAFADTTGSEGFNFLKTYSPEFGFG